MHSLHQRASLLTALIMSGALLSAMHNTNRYFPLIEWPQASLIPRHSNANISAFYTDASEAILPRDIGKGIPELWGKYNLCEVIKSLQAVCCTPYGQPVENPLGTTIGLASLQGKSIIYNVTGSIRSIGMMFQYEHSFPVHGWSLGFYLPVMRVHSDTFFCLNKNNSADIVCSLAQPAVDALDDVRREVQGRIGLCGSEWSKTGCGDLDLYLAWRNVCKRRLLMRKITTRAAFGVLCPTGTERDINNPASIPFAGNGHWGLYGDLLAEFELRAGITTGLWFAVEKYLPHTRCERIPVGCEPFMYAARCGEVDAHPGSVIKFSAYLSLDNLLDGLDFQGRFTLLRHAEDRLYLSVPVCGPVNVRNTQKLSGWLETFVSFQVTYDTKRAMRHWWLQPIFYGVYDMPVDFGAHGACRTHQVSFGVELHF